MVDVIALVPVDCFKGTFIGSWPDCVLCDMCLEDIITDAIAGKTEEGWRTFVRQRGGANDSLVVCSNCLDDFLSEPLT